MEVPHTMIPDDDLADTLIARLNKLIENPDVRKDVEALIEHRVPCSQATLDHPTIQAGWPSAAQDAGLPPSFGFLGLLNGIVGTLKGGPKKGWGYITATFDTASGTPVLTHFQRTMNMPVTKDESAGQMKGQVEGEPKQEPQPR